MAFRTIHERPAPWTPNAPMPGSIPGVFCISFAAARGSPGSLPKPSTSLGRLERLEPVLCGPQQRRANASASPGGADRELVQVAAPAIPTDDDRADQLAVMLREDHRAWVTAKQGCNRVTSIGPLLPTCPAAHRSWRPRQPAIRMLAARPRQPGLAAHRRARRRMNGHVSECGAEVAKVTVPD